ncbi:MAG: MATE family efflux transporter [Pseudomonadota bacterium]
MFDLWLPMIGGVLAVKLIGVSDAYFIGQLGEEELAAVSYTFPVVMTLITLAIGLSSGASSVLSRAIGEEEESAGRGQIVAGALGLTLLLSLAVAVLGAASIRTVLGLLGASGRPLDLATSYMYIWFSGMPVLMVPIVVNGILRATGDGTTPALLMSGIAALNIALNPILIYGIGPIPELGV